MTIYRRNGCICNSKKPHFCPPSLGEEGFYACDVEDIASHVKELKECIFELNDKVKDKEDAGIFGMAKLTKRIGELKIACKKKDQIIEDLHGQIKQQLIRSGVIRAKKQDERIAKLEADCADMAEDVIAEAGARHSDGEGGIHPALTGKYRRDTSTARKYIKDKEA